MMMQSLSDEQGQETEVHIEGIGLYVVLRSITCMGGTGVRLS